ALQPRARHTSFVARAILRQHDDVQQVHATPGEREQGGRRPRNAGLCRRSVDRGGPTSYLYLRARADAAPGLQGRFRVRAAGEVSWIYRTFWRAQMSQQADTRDGACTDFPIVSAADHHTSGRSRVTVAEAVRELHRASKHGPGQG